jgi:hypothetical protein
VSSTGGGSASVTLTGLALNVSVGHTVLISEFRFRGPNGANDEFVEIYNNTDASIDIGGYTLRGSNNAGTVSIRATVAAGAILPPHGHFLFVNGAAGTPNAARANQTYATGVTDDGGVAIARPDGVLLDQVGLSQGSAYREGTPLASLGATNSDHSYEREPGSAEGSGTDTGDNANDFQLIAPSDPQNLASPAAPLFPLTATAADASREFGAPNPVFSGTLTGVVNGDAVTASFDSPATASSSEGTYPIVPSLNDPDGRLANYQVTLVNGTLTVVDTHPPVLTLPPGISATATTPAGATVIYTASASDPVDGARPIACAPASGAVFAIGATTVACSATDSNGHSTSGSFVVTVTAADVPGRMTGDVTIAAGNTTYAVVFAVQEHATGANAGAVAYSVTTTTTVRGRRTDHIDTFVALSVTNVSFFDLPGVSPGTAPPSGIDTVTFEGTGRWNGRPGYRFSAQAVDAGEPGANRDRLAITIRDGSGTVVSTVNATITAGNIRSMRISQ